MTPDKIYLVGFMASGKSTVARALAARLGWQAEDVDALIEAREHRTIPEIFSRQGEPYFRQVERDILHVIAPLRHVVVATGGGTFVDPENRTFINMDGVSIWLDLPLLELIPRIPRDGRRPLAADRAELERLYVARVEAYRHAHIRIDASQAPPAAVVERVLDALRGVATTTPPPIAGV